MNLLRAALEWLLEKHVKEETTVSEPLNDTDSEQTAVVDPAPVIVDTPVTVADPTPATVANEGVQDFEKAFQFVADGVSKLGSAAESELIALAKKYL